MRRRRPSGSSHPMLAAPPSKPGRRTQPPRPVRTKPRLGPRATPLAATCTTGWPAPSRIQRSRDGPGVSALQLLATCCVQIFPTFVRFMNFRCFLSEFSRDADPSSQTKGRTTCMSRREQHQGVTPAQCQAWFVRGVSCGAQRRTPPRRPLPSAWSQSPRAAAKAQGTTSALSAGRRPRTSAPCRIRLCPTRSQLRLTYVTCAAGFATLRFVFCWFLIFAADHPGCCRTCGTRGPGRARRTTAAARSTRASLATAGRPLLTPMARSAATPAATAAGRPSPIRSAAPGHRYIRIL